DEIFPTKNKLFQQLASRQAPNALFVTCSDSRVVPAVITQTEPGELFIERNVGNIVPEYDDEPVDASASIEYAVTKLAVSHIIICGHSDCGAMTALLNPDSLGSMPAVGRWLRYSETALRRAERLFESGDRREELQLLIRQNVIVQMENLMTHPAVQRGVAAGQLRIHGWVYEIEHGRLWAYEPESRDFLPWPA
ncbi:MAG: carbonic anhydrase, partial [bacterium]